MNINKHLFAAYCGMIKSGYDLMDMSDEIVVTVCNWISNVDFTEDVLEYFRYTKTDMFEVNPYYPRGSDLSAACFFQDKSIDEYVAFLQTCESLEANNPEFIAWASELPNILKQIEKYEEFDEIYRYYEDALKKRFVDVAEQMLKIEKTLKNQPFTAQTSVVFAPNLLQAKFLADYALVGDTLYVISGNFKSSSVIHEYLHIALKPIRRTLLDIIQKHELNRFVDVKRMFELGYLRGDSDEERAHTLEECLVRTFCGVIDETLNLEEYYQENIRSGFYSVPQMMNRLLGLSWTEMTLEKMVLQAMNITK